MILIVDYATGNIGSIQRMLKKLGVQTALSKDPDEIRKAEKLILPGVGSFDSGMKKLDASGLRQALDDAALSNKATILGICLGMHLLFNSSEEGDVPGLGWIPGRVRRFDLDKQGSHKVPHMGWNLVAPVKKTALFSGLDDASRFYFVHSYYADPSDSANCVATSTYGYPFCSAVGKGNIFGVQFHPEKSHRFGLQLLQNFANI